MKTWIHAHRIEKTIRSNKGETLMESIVSMLILTILLIAVTTVIQTALHMTSISTQNAKAMQEETINPVMLADYRGSDNPADTTTVTITAAGISATHNVIFYTNSENGIIAFSPE